MAAPNRQIAGLREIACEVQRGTQDDARWYSFGANKTHGLRRSTEDKQMAIKAALLHPNSAQLSDREIARHVGVDHATVLHWRDRMVASGEVHQMDTRIVTRNGTTYQQNVANIGKSKRASGQAQFQTDSGFLKFLLSQEGCTRSKAGSRWWVWTTSARCVSREPHGPAQVERDQGVAVNKILGIPVRRVGNRVGEPPLYQ
jgi:hypothetical protein